MCQYQTLYYQENTGYIIRCMQCEKIQLSFGNVIISVDILEFNHFHRLIEKIYYEQEPGGDLMLKTLMIPTPCEGLQLFLSRGELNELYEMLETADTELRSSELLNLFSNP